MKGKLAIKIYKSGFLRRDWKWRAVAPNGRIIASGRGFNSRQLTIESLEVLIKYILGNKFYINKQ